MRKFLLSLFAVLTASMAFAGDGTKANPMTIADVLAAVMDSSEVYVKAYIVGSCTGTSISTAEFSVSENSSASNLLLADSQTENNVENVIAAQMPVAVREGLSLKNVPENFGKTVLVKAQLIKYFGKNGLKNITEYELSGEGVTPTPQPQGDNFESKLTDTQGDWTVENVTKPEELSFIWSQSSSYGMKASAYANSTKYVTESYLVSPAIILNENSVLTFDHVQRYAAEDPATQLTLWIRGDAQESWEYQLNIPTYSDGTSWTFVSSGEIDLSTYAGKKIHLYFKYTSNEDFAPTWEIKNVVVTNAKAADTPFTIANTPETAYSTTKAVEIIDEGKDLSTKVYVKGAISRIGIEGKEGGLTDLPGNSYGNATYFITDGTTEFEVYRGYFLNNEKFTAEDQIKVGDEVIVYGKLTKFKEIYELAAGSYIYSLNGTTAIRSINADMANGVIFDLCGRRVEKAVRGIYIVNGKRVVVK